jgi:hypothetical protein
MIRSRLLLVLVFAAACCGAAGSASAQSFGIRAGLSADPDQFLVGVHLESPGLTQTGHLTFRPNVDFGSKDGDTRISGNMEFVYWVAFPSSPWSGYFGGGPAIVYDHNDFDSRAHGGYNGVVGFQHSSGLFLEMKAGGGAGVAGLKGFVGYVIKKSK